MGKNKRLYVIDTNVLMHDPTALFRFQEHDIFLPMVVLEELDSAKKGMSEVARNVRQASRFLDEMMEDASQDEIAGCRINLAQVSGVEPPIAVNSFRRCFWILVVAAHREVKWQ